VRATAVARGVGVVGGIGVLGVRGGWEAARHGLLLLHRLDFAAFGARRRLRVSLLPLPRADPTTAGRSIGRQSRPPVTAVRAREHEEVTYF